MHRRKKSIKKRKTNITSILKKILENIKIVFEISKTLKEILKLFW